MKSQATTSEENENLVDDILQAIPNAVLLLDESQKILHVNGGFKKLCELSEKPARGTLLTDVIDREMLDRAIRRAINDSLAASGVEFRYRLNGADLLYSAEVIPMAEHRVLVIINDVTEEREKQERLYLTDRLASIGEMVAGVAHEMNNPLTSVLGLTELLLENDTLPGDVRQDLKDISREAGRAAAIIKNLLSFGRKRLPNKQMVELNNIALDVLKLRAYEHKVNNITVKTYLDNNLPELPVDPFQMQQVFLNIILNAESAMIESHNGGTLTVISDTTPYSARIMFADDGPGIPPGLLSRIFDPFFTTKDVGKGTGLGLSICYGIVHAHGGTIFADSRRKAGANFIIELPREDHPLNIFRRDVHGD